VSGLLWLVWTVGAENGSSWLRFWRSRTQVSINPRNVPPRGTKKFKRCVTYHAVSEAIHHLVKEASNERLVSREVVLATSEEDSDS